MTEVSAETTDLKAQYAAQVTADVQRNAEQQARINAELAALQDQLHALQRDQALLESMQQALTGHNPATTADASKQPDEASVTPLPQQGRRNKTSPGSPKSTKDSRKSAAAGTPVKAAGPPTLGELIRSHLTAQPEPRSAAEITTALTQAHPDRNVKATVVRTTVEGLVAKGRVERSKQGNSVFYSAVTESNGSAPTTPLPTDATTS
ncbi:BlaI/MecI/CopY family transcriptional regulator [Streptomycetaceae bacterium NBC_01309]